MLAEQNLAKKTSRAGLISGICEYEIKISRGWLRKDLATREKLPSAKKIHRSGLRSMDQTD